MWWPGHKDTQFFQLLICRLLDALAEEVNELRVTHRAVVDGQALQTSPHSALGAEAIPLLLDLVEASRAGGSTGGGLTRALPV